MLQLDMQQADYRGQATNAALETWLSAHDQHSSLSLFLLSIPCAHAVFRNEISVQTTGWAASRRLADSTPATSGAVAVAREMAGAVAG